MEEQFVSVLDYAKDVLGQISDFVSWPEWPKPVRFIVGISGIIRADRAGNGSQEKGDF